LLQKALKNTRVSLSATSPPTEPAPKLANRKSLIFDQREKQSLSCHFESHANFALNLAEVGLQKKEHSFQ